MIAQPVALSRQVLGSRQVQPPDLNLVKILYTNGSIWIIANDTVKVNIFKPMSDGYDSPPAGDPSSSTSAADFSFGRQTPTTV